MIDAASSDLIQRTARQTPMATEPAFLTTMQEIAKARGTYTDDEILLASLIVDELGITRALQMAVEYNTLDPVEDIFEEWCQLFSQEADAAHEYLEREAKTLQPFDHGRLLGMIEVYLAYGPTPEPTEEQMRAVVLAIERAELRVAQNELLRRAFGEEDQR